MDCSIEMAALSLGAGSWTLFRSGNAAAHPARSCERLGARLHPPFDEVTMTVFLAAPGIETLPVRMFLYIKTISTAGNIGLRKRDRDYEVALVLLDRFYGLERVLRRPQRSRAVGSSRCTRTMTSPS